jgi:hypothetical protein
MCAEINIALDQFENLLRTMIFDIAGREMNDDIRLGGSQRSADAGQ